MKRPWNVSARVALAPVSSAPRERLSWALVSFGLLGAGVAWALLAPGAVASDARSNADRSALFTCAAASATDLFTCAAPSSTEDPAPAPKEEPKKGEAEKPIERLTAWPKPTDKDTLMNDIERVVKAHVPAMAEQGRDGLIAQGAACAPFVLDRYGKERDEDARARLHEVLMAVTNGTHTRLLAKEFGSKLQLVRTFSLWRAAQFPDPELKKDAEAAWARVTKAGDKADPDERYAAALCCASTSSIVGLEALWDATRTPKMWDANHVEMRAALNGSRGKDATVWVLAKLTDAPDRKTKVAVLRMLAGCGERSYSVRVKPFLDDEDNQVRVAAINALRGMIDNEPPLENLSAFEAIEMANKWKGRS